MSQYFSEEIIEKVREATDIVAVISEHLQLKKAGANYKALCPFHLEKTPSFSINPQQQIFKCFGCGKGGNVFHFLMAIEGTTFPEVVTALAEKHGIVLPKKEYANPSGVSRKTAEEVLAWSALFFQKQLASKEGREAREYLQSRHISLDIIEKFQLGYALDSWDSLYEEAKREGFPLDVLVHTGLIAAKKNKKGYYDQFRHRLIFPICNAQGKVVAFGGRVLSVEDEPKYLNSPENTVFSKKKTLYAFHTARPHISQQSELLIMEGYIDVLLAHQYGFAHAVGTLGTSLTVEHAAFINRYTQSVVLVFDGDNAGVKAASRSLPYFLSQGLMVKIAVLPDNLDPGDFLPKRGAENFSALLGRADDFFDFQLRQLHRQLDMNTTSGRRNAIREVAAMVAKIPDQITRTLFIRRISEKFEIPHELLSSELRMGTTRATQGRPRSTLQTFSQQLYQNEERFILYISMHYPHWGKQLLADGGQYFKDPQLATLAKHIVRFVQRDVPLEIAKISAQLEPALGSKIVEIYGDPCWQREIEDIGKLEERINLILKGVARKRRQSKLAKFKQLLAEAHVEDDEFKRQILQDAHKISKGVGNDC